MGYRLLDVKRLLLSMMAAVILYPAAAYAAKEAPGDGDLRLPEGIFVENTDIGGMTKDGARSTIEALLEEIGQYQVRIDSGSKAFYVTFEELGVKPERASLIDEICNVGHFGSFFRRVSDMCKIAGGELRFELDFVCDRLHTEAVLEKRRPDIDSEAADASLIRKGGAFIIASEKNGQIMDAKATAESVASAIEQQWRDGRAGLLVKAQMETVLPEHTAGELSAVKDCLGVYETSFAGSADGRVANIKNGAAKLENTVVYPGGEYSFLQAMKPFSEENGYHVAGTYVNGRNTPGLGGGICQVSSTLYNAVLRAELTVTERTNHMMTVGYVPLGADATIADPSIDFRFRNDSGAPILIEAYTSGTMLYVNIYGRETRQKNRTVEFISVTEETVQPGADVVTYDSTKDADYFRVVQNAHTGYTAALYKNVYVDGRLAEQTLVNRSIYGAYPRYVVMGSG